MNSSFFVFNIRSLAKKLLIFLFIIGIGFSFYGVGNYVLEVANTNKRLPVYSVDTTECKVALTFDCAWGADDIDDILGTLNKNDVKATFFVVGDWVKKFPDKVEALSDAGMEIGNHSFKHGHVDKMSHKEVLEDMKNCNELIEKVTGNKVKFYRGPYGEYNNTVIEVAESLGMQVIQWDTDTIDYEGKTPDEMCERIKKKIKNGSIILMHNDTKYTASGLGQILELINNLGYQIVSLDELVYKDNYEINFEGRQVLK